MSKFEFRVKAPSRTYNGVALSDYRKYKPSLVKDFNEKCGYTDCHHSWFGGRSNFQIDHFKSKSKYPLLEKIYSNLVYSCSYVNRAKSNDDGNYLDPCNVNYNEHFHRDEFGNIHPNSDSESAKYQHKKLKLYLKRYGIIWTLQQLEDRLSVLRTLIEKTGNAEAIDLYLKIDFKFHDYLKYLRAEQ